MTLEAQPGMPEPLEHRFGSLAVAIIDHEDMFALDDPQ